MIIEEEQSCLFWSILYLYSYLNREVQHPFNQAGHSVGVRPSPIPNLEVKPNVAVVLLRCESSWEVAVLAFYILKNSKIVVYCNCIMATCSVCGEDFSDDIRFLNHMMEKHGFRNPNVDKPDRNSRGY